MASPLFALLKKNVKWRWGPTEDHAFQEIKRALQAAPVLGHPLQGQPYRLYSDASDEALGCALQQVQEIEVKDLKGTKHFDRLEKAYREEKEVPRLVTTLSQAPEDSLFTDKWAQSLEETKVHVERVIGYWSRTFKPAEKNYSVTEREALAAKEGLVKFQPFIEGEKVSLVTDHSALQWARTYENANRRLAAWGAVFSAYKPGLTICYRPGRVHSNVDPLSRLSRLPRDRETGELREPPAHQSPSADETASISTDASMAERVERKSASKPKESFWSERSPNVARVSHAVMTRAAARHAGGPSTDTPGPPGVIEELDRDQAVRSRASKESLVPADLDPHERKERWELETREGG